MLPHVLASTVRCYFPSIRYIAAIAVDIIRRYFQIILPSSLLPVHSGVGHHHQTTAQTQLAIHRLTLPSRWQEDFKQVAWMVTSLPILRNRQKVRNVHGGALSG